MSGDYREKYLKDPVYAIEAAKGEFIIDVTESICDILEKDQVSRQDLAKKMNKTKGYVSQLLNGNRNMTLGTLAEIAHILGYAPKISFEEKSDSDSIVETVTVEMKDRDCVYKQDTKIAA